VILWCVRVTVVATEGQQCVLCALLEYSRCQICTSIVCCITMLLRRICVPAAMEPAEGGPAFKVPDIFVAFWSKFFVFSTDLHNNNQDQISRKSVRWEKRWYTRTDARRDSQRNRQKEKEMDGRTDGWTWRSFWLTYWVKSRVVTSPEINAANTIRSSECAYPSVPQNNRYNRWPNSKKISTTIQSLTLSNISFHNCQQLTIKTRGMNRERFNCT